MTPPSKIDRDTLRGILQDKCISNISQDEILVTASSVQSDVQIKEDIDVTRKTLRNKGICPQGYFQKKYPNSVSYKIDGSPELRGMIIETKQFLIDTDMYQDQEELAEDFEEIRVCELCEQMFSEPDVEVTEDSIICKECHEKALEKGKEFKKKMDGKTEVEG